MSLMTFRRRRLSAHDTFEFRVQVMGRDLNSPLETVSCRQDPLVVDQGAPAGMPAVFVQAGLPGPGPRRSILASHNLGVEWRDAANWTENTNYSRLTEDRRLNLRFEVASAN